MDQFFFPNLFLLNDCLVVFQSFASWHCLKRANKNILGYVNLNEYLVALYRGRQCKANENIM